MNYFDAFYKRLQDAISDGGLAARDRIEADARAADDLEITFPTYAALTTWGSEGFDLIIKIAIDGHTVKSKSAALTLFAMFATSGQLDAGGTVMIAPAFAAFVNKRLEATMIKPLARQALRMLVMSLPTDDLLIPLSQSFVHLQFQSLQPQSPELTQELVASLGAKWLRFGTRWRSKCGVNRTSMVQLSLTSWSAERTTAIWS